MSTDFSMGKYLGSRISIFSLTGKYLGYIIYVLFFFTYHIPIQPVSYTHLTLPTICSV